MVLRNVQRMDRLFEVLDDFDGNVALVTPEGRMDWKTCKNTIRAMAAALPAKEYSQIELDIEKAADQNLMVKYLIGAY